MATEPSKAMESMVCPSRGIDGGYFRGRPRVSCFRFRSLVSVLRKRSCWRETACWSWRLFSFLLSSRCCYLRAGSMTWALAFRAPDAACRVKIKGKVCWDSGTPVSGRRCFPACEGNGRCNRPPLSLGLGGDCLWTMFAGYPGSRAPLRPRRVLGRVCP